MQAAATSARPATIRPVRLGGASERSPLVSSSSFLAPPWRGFFSAKGSYLGTKLTEPLPTTDGGTLRTIGDATRYMTKLPKHREEKNAPVNEVQWDGKPIITECT